VKLFRRSATDLLHDLAIELGYKLQRRTEMASI